MWNGCGHTRLFLSFQACRRETITGWEAATEKAEAGAHHYRYNNLGNGKGVWRFKEKQV